MSKEKQNKDIYINDIKEFFCCNKFIGCPKQLDPSPESNSEPQNQSNNLSQQNGQEEQAIESKNGNSIDLLWISKEFEDIFDIQNYGIRPEIHKFPDSSSPKSLKIGSSIEIELVDLYQIKSQKAIMDLKEPILSLHTIEINPIILVGIGNKMRLTVIGYNNNNNTFQVISKFFLNFLEKESTNGDSEKQEVRSFLSDRKKLKMYENQEITAMSVEIDDKTKNKNLTFFTVNNFCVTYTIEQFYKLIVKNAVISKRKIYQFLQKNVQAPDSKEKNQNDES
ncbi:hypothetical protein M9Y10_013055 [Tritrichomonas musculus]|uniref:Uncharacterized protein n=1 Tax=Tritrichomonas musculus TaxID=1915356 RepID=A0ABR2I6V7_9EUKA